jgi:hypothetical protein
VSKLPRLSGRECILLLLGRRVPPLLTDRGSGYCAAGRNGFLTVTPTALLPGVQILRVLHATFGEARSGK